MIKNNEKDQSDIIVAISQTYKAVYPERSPYHPGHSYPEYPFNQNDYIISNECDIYDAVRRVLYLIGLDHKHYDKPEWNPLGDLVNKDSKVLITPNLVYDKPHDLLDVMITHPSVLRPILDYLFIAMKGRGTIVIGDCPIQGTDFNRLMENGYYSLVAFYDQFPDFKIEIIDFRNSRVAQDDKGIITKKFTLEGDPNGYTEIDLAKKSMINEISHLTKRFRVNMYDPRVMKENHSENKHRYLVANTVLDADLIISATKLKTHKLAGITGALKSVVGLMGRKDCLPHHTLGSIVYGGDQYRYPSIRKWTISKLLDIIDSTEKYWVRRSLNFFIEKIYQSTKRFPFKDRAMNGNWYGNDTLWRMILDIFHIVLYKSSNHKPDRKEPRQFLTIVDGVISGEKQGPMNPTAKNTKWIFGSLDPVAVDLVSCEMMGFDYRKIPQINNAIIKKEMGIFRSSVKNIKVFLDKNQSLSINELDPIKKQFIPHEGWKDILSS